MFPLKKREPQSGKTMLDAPTGANSAWPDWARGRQALRQAFKGSACLVLSQGQELLPNPLLGDDQDLSRVPRIDVPVRGGKAKGALVLLDCRLLSGGCNARLSVAAANASLTRSRASSSGRAVTEGCGGSTSGLAACTGGVSLHVSTPAARPIGQCVHSP